jgi:hypothetical protein
LLNIVCWRLNVNMTSSVYSYSDFSHSSCSQACLWEECEAFKCIKRPQNTCWNSVTNPSCHLPHHS